MNTRPHFTQRLHQEILDALVIGGGIHGASSAAALSHAGYRVGLVEAGDFASETSQASSNMIWGGIKYFESLDFALVRELCHSRNALLRHYPNQVKEIRFYAVCEKPSPRPSPDAGASSERSERPAWQLQIGAWLYWLWGNARTATPRRLRPKNIREEEPVLNSDRWTGGVEYSDAYLPETDARFAFGFIERAWRNGAAAVNYVRAISCHKVGSLWETEVVDQITGAAWTIRSKVVVNAAGPWAETLAKSSGVPPKHRLAFSKGVHLIVPRLSDEKRVLSFFSSDGRPFFILPLGGKTCLGTTDTRIDRPSKEVTPEDRAFILENINQRLNLARPLVEADIIAERCGVRPLVLNGGENTEGNWMNLSRKHRVEISNSGFISILGGKMTDCLNIGNEILAAANRCKLQPT
ncbi:MAG: FAD-dependent oxidoreductase, partial [Spirochaetia bacterium]|nr:FAD-dependent oxidoreductase [Spirochaetia bacterium]